MSQIEVDDLSADLYAPETRTSSDEGSWNMPIPFDVQPLREVEDERRKFEERLGRKLGLLARMAESAEEATRVK